ncbi:alpha-E domain-containing protein [Chamaesiphon minutus]|uniref:DUF403 domain-containing protein n=1 Tax=Chamaesiphon minutus (strain ATCC 27169 / PCC 6605) TaxID=1173020 RepID=K9UNJ7_CHAP6|nr:alpha-E domain-containing protein [Chamaesiphon minutus]AFY96011.1 hypothetical protein Cha6605_5112 [Chamaesiphon minutus PCC 6605]
MLSRVANSIYWLNRYIERAENIARFVDVNLNLLLDSIIIDDRQWEPIVMTTGDLDIFYSRYGAATAENVVQFLTYDEKYPNSILSCLQFARENARSIQEIISSEMWEQVNSFYFMVRDAAAATVKPELPEFLAAVKMASHQFAGVMDATMSHNEGWHFGQIGRSIERADKTARILDVKYFIILPNGVGSSLDELQWIALLKSASAYEMYRKIYRRINPTDIARFLIFDRQFPRSILYCLNATEKCLYLISGNHLDTGCNLAERQLGRLRSELDFLSLEEVIQRGLHEFLDETQSRLNLLSNEISKTFLTIDERVTL